MEQRQPKPISLREKIIAVVHVRTRTPGEVAEILGECGRDILVLKNEGWLAQYMDPICSDTILYVPRTKHAEADIITQRVRGRYKMVDRGNRRSSVQAWLDAQHDAMPLVPRELQKIPSAHAIPWETIRALRMSFIRGSTLYRARIQMTPQIRSDPEMMGMINDLIRRQGWMEKDGWVWSREDLDQRAMFWLAFISQTAMWALAVGGWSVEPGEVLTCTGKRAPDDVDEDPDHFVWCSGKEPGERLPGCAGTHPPGLYFCKATGWIWSHPQYGRFSGMTVGWAPVPPPDALMRMEEQRRKHP